MRGRQLKQSRFGVISMVMFIMVIISIIILTFMDIVNYDFNNVNSASQFLNKTGTVVFLLCIVIFNLVGTITGIIGIFKAHSKKKLAVSGFILNGLLTAWFLSIILL